MFNWLAQMIVALILGLCGWIWFQSQKIDSLRAENQVQAQTIKQQQQANKRLTDTLEQERHDLPPKSWTVY